MWTPKRVIRRLKMMTITIILRTVITVLGRVKWLLRTVERMLRLTMTEALYLAQKVMIYQTFLWLIKKLVIQVMIKDCRPLQREPPVSQELVVYKAPNRFLDELREKVYLYYVTTDDGSSVMMLEHSKVIAIGFDHHLARTDTTSAKLGLWISNHLMHFVIEFLNAEGADDQLEECVCLSPYMMLMHFVIEFLNAEGADDQLEECVCLSPYMMCLLHCQLMHFVIEFLNAEGADDQLEECVCLSPYMMVIVARNCIVLIIYSYH
ncbi:uncharacterized protein [Arachis hypogaea]|uniref:uncharacterized protein isoform X3 n=1 Tax=Arachis hypogaea TaxID=3818 RepID=UPI003B2186EC